jgi:hypothetical protein
MFENKLRRRNERKKERKKEREKYRNEEKGFCIVKCCKWFERVYKKEKDIERARKQENGG